MKNFSRLGFGLSSIAGSGNFIHQERLIKTAIDNGITHFDVAPYYGSGDAEIILGKVLKTCKENVTITTKFGLIPFNVPSPLLKNIIRPIFRRLKFLKKIVSTTIQSSYNPHISSDYIKGSIISSVDDSIKKLGRPIDIFLLHDANSFIANNSNCIDEINYIKSCGKSFFNGLSGDILELQNILANNNEAYSVLQLENSLTKKADLSVFLSKNKFVITHRAIQGGINELNFLINNRPNFKKLLGDIINNDITDKIIPQLLVELALHENLHGCVLFSTTKTSRIIDTSIAIVKPIITNTSKYLQVRNLFDDIYLNKENI